MFYNIGDKPTQDRGVPLDLQHKHNNCYLCQHIAVFFNARRAFDGDLPSSNNFYISTLSDGILYFKTSAHISLWL